MSEENPMIIGVVGGTAFTEADILANSLSVTMSTCDKGNFTFGTFRAAVLKVTFILTGELSEVDFSGAMITLEKNGTGINNLGTYWVDDSKTKRRGKLLTIEALDAASLFDVELPDSVRAQTYTAATAIAAACAEVNCSMRQLQSGLPNSEVTFTPSSASIQTWRDLVMWVAQLLGCNAVIDREGYLVIRPAGYSSGQQSSYTSDGADRVDIQYADIRTWVKYLTAYSAHKVKTYTGGNISEANARPGYVTLPLNPLLDGKTEAECDTINTAIRASVGSLVRDITAKCTDDPSVCLGDMANFTGGRVHSTGSGALGVVTAITWRFRGITTITCTAPTSVKEVQSNA